MKDWNADDFTEENLKRTVEANINMGLAMNANLTGLTIDKAHHIVEPMMEILFKSNLHITKMYIEKLKP